MCLKGSKISILCMTLLTILLGGCESAGGLASGDRFDRQSALSYSAADNALAFARTDGRYSLSSRDYLYIGPVEINEQGTREYFLWVGVGTTLDRGFTAPESSTPISINMLIEDEPIQFVLHPWRNLVPDLTHDAFYSTPVTISEALGARLTHDQIELIASGAPSSIRVNYEDRRSATFVAWDATPDWSAFLVRVERTARR
jgi:hypothetical protein